MLIAKHKDPPKDLHEHLERVRAAIRNFGENNEGKCLFEEKTPGFWRLIIHIAALIGMIGGWLLVLLSGVLFESNVTRLSIAAFALVCTIYQWVEDRLEKKNNAKHNALARVALGAVIQANSDLYDEDNEDPQAAAALVTLDPELEKNPALLLQKARELFELRTADPSGLHPVLQKVAAELEDETPVWEARHRLPREFIGNDDSYVFHVVFFPDELPRGYADRGLWFFLFHAEDPSVWTKPLPAELWWQEESDHLFYLDDDAEAVG